MVIALSALLGSCQEHVRYSLLLEVRTEAVISNMVVLVKRYHLDGTTMIYPENNMPVPGGEDGYVRTVAGEPLRLRIILPDRGLYAVHIVGTPIADDPDRDPLITTTCREVTGQEYLTNVYLGRLTADNDLDGDTFPEDIELFCALVSVGNTTCDRTCATAQYLAMGDCNPPEGYSAPEWCGEVPADEQWHPFVVDGCGDCHDQDCWGGDEPCVDADGDDYPSNVDCNDEDPAINPGVEEICGNGVDDNCRVEIAACSDGDLPCDGDGDGFRAPHPTLGGCGVDCDDSDPAINPGALEGCGADPEDPEACPGCQPTGVDDNCNRRFEEGCFDEDMDDDGVLATQDCNDCNASVGPGFDESCGDGIDQDCSREPDGGDQVCSPDDLDADGFEGAPVGPDCDDTDPRVYPEAPERCGDGVAQDCIRDVPCSEITDVDGDGFGTSTGDCNDHLAAANPWAAEVCDAEGVDEDCDGQVNEVVADAAGQYGCVLPPGSTTWQEVAFTDDVDHCGRCRHRCCPSPLACEGRACVGGLCQCEGLGGCDGTATSSCCEGVGCVDLSSDLGNCGACGHQCDPGEECFPQGEGRPGLCGCRDEPGQRDCDAERGEICCGGVGCTDPSIDELNCGGCGNDCTLGEHPQGTLCSPVDGVPRCHCGLIGSFCVEGDWCTDVAGPEGCGCQDLDSDVANCGACDLRCGINEICRDGGCWCEARDLDCEGDTPDCCPDTCTNLESDPSHCGSCGNRCAWGEQCEAGRCLCDAVEETACDETRQDCCGGTCRSVLTERDHCGALGTGEGCEHACSSGLCYDGGCGCLEGFVDCEDRCDCETGDNHVCCGGNDCRTGNCCDDGNCTADNTHCSGGWCACDSGWSSCGGTCNCHTGSGQVCCGGVCHDGECCQDSDCSGSHRDCRDYDCRCDSGWSSCGGTCNCNTGSGQVCCDNRCYDGNCCRDSDCSGGNHCHDHRCS